jgi:transposase-like protein
VLRPQVKVLTSKYLNNIVEQDPRRVKQRIYPMRGFKSFKNATITITGIELAQQIRKGQFDTSAVIVSEGARVSPVWEAVLSV